MENKEIEIPYNVFMSNLLLFKTVLFIGCLLAGLIVFFASTTAYYFKKKEKTPEPIIFEIKNKGQSIVQIDRGQELLSTGSLLRSMTMRNYVFDRESINHINDKTRFERIQLMSSKNVWNLFQSTVNPEINPNSPLLNMSFTREIEQITDFPLPSQTNVHRVEFYIIDKINGRVVEKTEYVSVIQYDASNAKVKYEDRFLNIEGIEIIDYQIYKRE